MYVYLVAFFLVSITVSFLCSLWEAVLLSVSPSYMQTNANEGGRFGKVLQGFKENIDRPLAGILTLNTIAHTVGAIGVGQQAEQLWGEGYPFVTRIIVPVAMTAAILILSEIIPKTIGVANWRALAPFTVRSLQVVLIVLAPVIWVCQKVTGVFNPEKVASVFSRSDFMAMAQIGASEGHLDAVESKFIQSLLQFKNRKAKEVMTPRTVIVSAPETATIREFYDMQEDLVFSRIPLRQGDNPDTITGYVLKDEVLEYLVDGEQTKTLGELKREIVTVPENCGVLQVFGLFLEKREHIALVVDEFGGTCGVMTMEDVIETLLGTEIVDETDKAIDLQAFAKLRWKNRYKKPSPPPVTS